MYIVQEFICYFLTIYLEILDEYEDYFIFNGYLI
jgi:hypothetical protein